MGFNTVCLKNRRKSRFVDYFCLPEDKKKIHLSLSRAREVADDVSRAREVADDVS